MRKIISFSAILALSLIFSSLESASPIDIIYVDEASEQKLGKWPISRDNYAKALQVLSQDHQPKIIVLKIFLDSSKVADKFLAEKLKGLNNVYTQALAVDEGKPWNGKLPIEPLSKNSFGYPEHNSAWVPNPSIARYFKGIGLVNGKVDEKGKVVGFYLVNSIQGQVYSSLPLMLDHAWKGTAIKFDPKALGSDGSIPLPSIPKPLPWRTYSFIDLIERKIPKNQFKDRIVFVFYKGTNSASLTLSTGESLDPAQAIALVTDFLLEQKK